MMFALVLMLGLTVPASADSALRTAPVVLRATRYSENGLWTRKIGTVTWYFDINDYTSRAPGEKAYGVVYIYRGSANLNKHKWQAYGQYYKLGTNKYYVKYTGGKITFQVSKKTIKLTHTSGKITNRKLNGVFKLVRRHYA